MGWFILGAVIAAGWMVFVPIDKDYVKAKRAYNLLRGRFRVYPTRRRKKLK
jgi:hypothetical protein